MRWRKELPSDLAMRWRIALLLGPHPHRHGVDPQRPPLAVADLQPGPPRLRLPRRPGVDAAERHLALAAPAGTPSRGTPTLQVADVGVAGDVEHIPLAVAAEPAAELRRSAHLVVAADPGVGQALAASLEQVDGDPPRLLEGHRLGDMALGAADRVGRPVLGQVQSAVQRRVAAGGGVGEEDADLAVVLLAQPAAPLPGHPARLAPRLGEAAGVEDQDRVRVGQDLADVVAELGHDGLVVPAAGADEVLDGLAVDAGLDGDRLAGLPL